MPSYTETTFTANGTSDAFEIERETPISLSGLTSGSGQISLHRSTDSGKTYNVVKMPDFTDADFTADADFNIEEPFKALYRFVSASYVSGSFVCRAGVKGA